MPVGIDDEAGAERVDAARRRALALSSLALTAAVEELLEEFLERRIRAAACGVLAAALRASTFCEVEILTTASITCSATSAIASGPRASDGTASAGSMIATVAAATAGWRACRANRPIMPSMDV